MALAGFHIRPVNPTKDCDDWGCRESVRGVLYHEHCAVCNVPASDTATGLYTRDRICAVCLLRQERDASHGGRTALSIRG